MAWIGFWHALLGCGCSGLSCKSKNVFKCWTVVISAETTLTRMNRESIHFDFSSDRLRWKELIHTINQFILNIGDTWNFMYHDTRYTVFKYRLSTSSYMDYSHVRRPPPVLTWGKLLGHAVVQRAEHNLGRETKGGSRGRTWMRR